MSSDTLEVYRHSGKFTTQGLLLPIAAAAVVGYPLGLAYAYLIRWIPIAYVNMLVTAGYGFVFGWLTQRLLKSGRVRNKALAGLCGAIAGLIGLYWNWNGHVHLLFSDKIWFFRPDQIVRAMGYLYEHGSWTISSHGSGGDAVTGVFLAIVWVAEAGVIVGLAAFIPYSYVSSTPFCEKSGAWLDQARNIDTLESIDDAGQVALLQGGSLQPVLDAKPRAAGAPTFTRLSLKRAKRPTSFCTLCVIRVTRRTDKKGKVQETSKFLTGDFIIPESMFDLLAQFGELKPGAPNPA